MATGPLSGVGGIGVYFAVATMKAISASCTAHYMGIGGSAALSRATQIVSSRSLAKPLAGLSGPDPGAN
jgi:hypothetical protein